MTRFEVQWAEAAVEDLEEIIGYLSTDSPAAAKEMLARLRARAGTLTSSPHRGRVVPGLSRFGIRGWREMVVGPYRIVYRIAGKDVWVLAVLDSRRDLQDLLLERLLRR